VEKVREMAVKVGRRIPEGAVKKASAARD